MIFVCQHFLDVVHTWKNAEGRCEHKADWEETHDIKTKKFSGLITLSGIYKSKNKKCFE